jgi:hypothetical protein
MVTLEELHDMWEQDSRIDPTKIKEISLETPILHAKYLKYLSLFKLQYRRKDHQYKTLYQNKKLWYDGHLSKERMDTLGWKYDPFDGASVSKAKAKQMPYYDSDPDLQESKSSMEYTKVVVEYLEEIIGNLNWRHNTIKNYIELRKFEQQ